MFNHDNDFFRIEKPPARFMNKKEDQQLSLAKETEMK